MFSGLPMLFGGLPEDCMSSKKQPVTVAIDEPDLELVKRLAERERSTPSGVIRRFVAEGLHALQQTGTARAA
jgi:hypothetical protein